MKIDVSGLGNSLVDILVHIDEDFLRLNRLNKGIMHLIDKNKRARLLRAIKDKKKEMQVGGSCPNTIATLALLGLNVALAGKIGNDELGAIFQEKITEKGVISYLKKEEGDTGTSIILITPDKERTMNTHLGVCREFKKEDLPLHIIKNSHIFYFTGYMWDTENQKEATWYALNTAKKSGVKIVFDVADPFAVERYREDFLKLIEEDVDIVLANASEAQILTKTNIDKGINRLRKLCDMAVIKNGEKDTIIGNKKNITSVPVFKSSVEDTTGAGDNFAAGFIYGLMKGYSIELCGRIASFVASKTIEKIGAQAPDNIRKLVEDMLSS